MPEGDTIHRTAITLSKALTGKSVIFVRSQAPQVSDEAAISLAGNTILSVEAIGKNLLINFSGGLSLHTHMKMTGSWHIYRKNQKWRRPAWLARIVIDVTDFVAVCFNAPVVRLLTEKQKQDEFRTLGPDVAVTFDSQEILRSFRLYHWLEIGEAIINQRILSGVGNVFKSEILYHEKINPFARVSALSDEELIRIIETSGRMLRENIYGDSIRSTRKSLRGGSYFVYGRSRLPCRACGTNITVRRQGDARRSTYYCPKCQNGPDS